MGAWFLWMISIWQKNKHSADIPGVWIHWSRLRCRCISDFAFAISRRNSKLCAFPQWNTLFELVLSFNYDGPLKAESAARISIRSPTRHSVTKRAAARVLPAISTPAPFFTRRALFQRSQKTSQSKWDVKPLIINNKYANAAAWINILTSVCQGICISERRLTCFWFALMNRLRDVTLFSRVIALTDANYSFSFTTCIAQISHHPNRILLNLFGANSTRYQVDMKSKVSECDVSPSWLCRDTSSSVGSFLCLTIVQMPRQKMRGKKITTYSAWSLHPRFTINLHGKWFTGPARENSKLSIQGWNGENGSLLTLMLVIQPVAA